MTRLQRYGVIFAALVGLAPTHGQAADAPADNETAITGSATGFYYAMRDQPDFGVGVASNDGGHKSHPSVGPLENRLG